MYTHLERPLDHKIVVIGMYTTVCDDMIVSKSSIQLKILVATYNIIVCIPRSVG